MLADIHGVRQQYLDSRYRILQAVQNNDRAGAINEMMTNTLNLQQSYKAKVQALIAIQTMKCRVRASRWKVISAPIVSC